jgi:hypothetical protein
MDDQRERPAASWQDCVSLEGKRMLVLAEDAPLPEGVEEGDEGVFVIRLVAATREMIEAENVAY